MSTYARDVLEALAVMRSRGHVPDKLTAVVSGAGRSYIDYECNKCSMELRITHDPLPNETFASGKALALDCTEVQHEHV